MVVRAQGRRTIHAALQAYETYLREVGEPQLPRQQFEIAKPICRQIVEQGTWPADCWFTASTTIETRDGITYDHHQVRLALENPDQGKPFQFSILVLDVFSGPVDKHSSPRAVNAGFSEKNRMDCRALPETLSEGSWIRFSGAMPWSTIMRKASFAAFDRFSPWGRWRGRRISNSSSDSAPGGPRQGLHSLC